MNKAFLGKSLWRFGTEEGGLWKRVLVWKYGLPERDWFTNEVKEDFQRHVSFFIGDLLPMFLFGMTFGVVMLL